MFYWRHERKEKMRILKIVRKVRRRLKKCRFKSIDGDDFRPTRELKKKGLLPTT